MKSQALTPTANLGLTYRALAGPCRVYNSRVYDTRISDGIINATGTRSITVHGKCEIPATARQTTGSIASTEATSNGYFTGFGGFAAAADRGGELRRQPHLTTRAALQGQGVTCR